MRLQARPLHLGAALFGDRIEGDQGPMKRFVRCDFSGCRHIFPVDDLPLDIDPDGRFRCSCGDGWLKAHDSFSTREGIELGFINRVVLDVERGMRHAEHKIRNIYDDSSILGANLIISDVHETFRQAGYTKSLLDALLSEDT